MLKPEHPMTVSKTTLKWTEDGELSAIDKARILSVLNNDKLTEGRIDHRSLSQRWRNGSPMQD